MELLPGVRHWPWIDDPKRDRHGGGLPARADGHSHRNHPSAARRVLPCPPPSLADCARSVVAAALAGAIYLITAPKTGDLVRARVPLRPVRPARLRGLERRLVRRPSHAGVQHPVPATGVAAGARGGRRDRGARGGRRLRAARTPALRRRGRAGARCGSALATCTMLFTGRLPFALGIALGLASLLALQRGERRSPSLLALLCPLGSPVAARSWRSPAVAVAVTDRASEGAPALLVAAAGIVPTLLLAVAFPEGGHQPYACHVVPAGAGDDSRSFVLLLPREERTLRIGVALYGLAAIVAFVLAHPAGREHVAPRRAVRGAASRCAHCSPPPAIVGPAGRARGDARRRLLLAAGRPVRAAHERRGRPVALPRATTGRSWQFLKDNPEPPGRVEVVFTDAHWESAYVAIHEPIARGWERQLDIGRNSLFYDGTLTRATYRAVAARQRGALGGAAGRQARLQRARGGAPRGRRPAVPEARAGARPHWRVYEVTPPHPLVALGGRRRASMRLSFGAEQRAARRGPPGQRARARALDSVLGRERRVRQSAPAHWTRVTARTHRNAADAHRFCALRVFEHGRRCA